MAWHLFKQAAVVNDLTRSIQRNTSRVEANVYSYILFAMNRSHGDFSWDGLNQHQVIVFTFITVIICGQNRSTHER